MGENRAQFAWEWVFCKAQKNAKVGLARIPQSHAKLIKFKLNLMETSFKKMLIFTSLCGVLFGTLGGGVTTAVLFQYMDSSSEISESDTTINFENGSYNEVVTSVSPAVVSIVAMKDLSNYYNQMPFFLPSQEEATPSQEEPTLSQVSSGTGFIVTADGLVVTNKHVVEDDSAEYLVILDDGTELEAEVLAKDTLNDIAIVQIVGEDERLGELPAVEFGDSDQIQVGDPVIAIGNALGEYSNTTTAGIISATDRQIVASGGAYGAENLVNLIQTDAAINPGNSGGPLFNMAGEVIGMNTAIDTTASGIGFAIPSNDIAGVVLSYQENGEIVRPFVGVRYVPVTPRLIKHFQLEVEYGAYVISDPESGPGVVEGSPADKAGIQEGDVILSLNGKELSDSFTLQNAIASYVVGDTVQLEVWRDGETLKLELTLATAE